MIERGLGRAPGCNMQADRQSRPDLGPPTHLQNVWFSVRTNRRHSTGAICVIRTNLWPAQVAFSGVYMHLRPPSPSLTGGRSLHQAGSSTSATESPRLQQLLCSHSFPIPSERLSYSFHRDHRFALASTENHVGKRTILSYAPIFAPYVDWGHLPKKSSIWQF